MPNSTAQRLLRYFFASWMFRDASAGKLRERAAAYSHNRAMRSRLPAYLWRWLAACGVALTLTSLFDALYAATGGGGVYLLLAAACGTLFAFGICVLFVTAYAYVYLSRHEG